MVNLRIDKKHNSLHIKIIGINTREQISTAIAQVFELAARLEDNFCIINDLSQFSAVSTEEFSLVCKVHLMISEKFKLGKVIRITGRSKETLLTFSKLDSKFGLENIHYVPTMSKALELAGSADS